MDDVTEPDLRLPVHDEVVGRDDELAAIDRWLHATTDQPGVLVIEGPPGIGKTALVRAAVRVAEQGGWRVLRCGLVEAEEGLTFAALADLLDPVTAEGGLAEVPPARRRALESALLLGDAVGAPTDERAVAFGALDAIRRAVPPDGGVAIVVDDAQWLDSSSALVLGYLVRRLARDPRFRVLVAARPDSRRAARVTDAVEVGAVKRLVLGPLSLGAIHRIVRTATGEALARPRLTEIHAQSDGNPFYAVAMARMHAGHQVGPGLSKDAAVDARLDGLDPATLGVLRVIALADAPTLEQIESVVGEGAGAAHDAAVAAGLVERVGDRVRFTHPLLTRAVIDDAGADALRDVHAALAAVSQDVERRAFHLALAATGPDGDVAALLDVAAAGAETRGAPAAAADLHGLAADLTPAGSDPAIGRRLAEARAAFRSGDADRARTILDEVGATSSSLRFRASLLRGVVEDETRGGDAGAAHFEAALGSDDAQLRSEAHRHLAQSLLFTGDFERALRHVRDAVAAAEQTRDPVATARALACQAMVEFCMADGTWRTSLDAALTLDTAEPTTELELTPAAVAADLARLSLDLERAVDAYAVLLDRARTSGDLVGEGWALFGLASSWISRSVPVEAEVWTTELEMFAEQTDTMVLQARRCRASATALAGDLRQAHALAQRGLEIADERGEPFSVRAFAGILGHIALLGGQNDEAVAQFVRCAELARGLGIRDPGMRIADLDLIEALVAAGALDDAREVLDDYSAVAADAGHRWCPAVVARMAGVVAAGAGDLEDAERSLLDAVERSDALWSTEERARSLILLARVLRRLKRRARAREALLEARDELASVPGSPFVAVIDRELEQLNRATDPSGLTVAELAVARMVGAGASNAEAAAALFVSVRTVEAHLTRIYRKLGIRSRSQLARMEFGDSTDAESPDET